MSALRTDLILLFSPLFCLHILYNPLFWVLLPTLLPNMFNKMIISAISALGLQGKKHLLTSPWLIDSVASNHMIGNLAALHDVRKYDGKQHMQIANGSTLPMIGTMGSSFTNAFEYPGLSANLISVRKLVEETCSLHIDHSNSNCVQDQASG